MRIPGTEQAGRDCEKLVPIILVSSLTKCLVIVTHCLPRRLKTSGCISSRKKSAIILSSSHGMPKAKDGSFTLHPPAKPSSGVSLFRIVFLAGDRPNFLTRQEHGDYTARDNSS